MYNFNIKIFLSLFQRTKFIFKILYPPVSKIHFPGEKTVAKVKPRNIRWYFELVRHQYHLVSQISKGFTIAKSKRAFDPLCYTVLQSWGKKIPVQPYRHGISLPFFALKFQLFIYREQTANTNENSIHKVLRLNEKRSEISRKRLRFLPKEEIEIKGRLNIFLFYSRKLI